MPEVEPTAHSFTHLLPWVVAPSPSTSSAGAATVSAVLDEVSLRAQGALESANQLGPLSVSLESLRSFSLNQPPPGSTAGTANYTQMDQWLAGIPGLASSTGALGFTDNAVSYDPYVATHAGVLQTANRFGPMFFDLNVLKAIGFTQAPTGAVLMNGQPDNFSAVDIGRWSAGIPGVITNSGTTGFVTYQDFGNGPISDGRIGGLHTTTQIGSMTFDFNFLPSISTGIIPPSLSFGLAPDMTAVNTPFAPLTPPPPGVVQPGGGLVAPTPVVAPRSSVAVAAPISPAPVPTPLAERADADPGTAATETVEVSSVAVADEESSPVIPGVNGAPLAKPRTTAKPGAGGGDPFAPIKSFTDAISNGLGALTGVRPAPVGPATSGTGSAGGSGTGSETGGTAGSGAG